jgi:hypothetical protein
MSIGTVGEVLWDVQALHGRTAAEISQRTHADTRQAIERSKAAMSDLVRDVLDGDSMAVLREHAINLRVTSLGLRSGGARIAQQNRVVLENVDYGHTANTQNWVEDGPLAALLEGTLFLWYLRDVGDQAAYPVVWSHLWYPEADQARRIQEDYTQVRDRIAAGEHLAAVGSFVDTCPRHSGGFDRANPQRSDSKSLTDHPMLPGAERRAWTLKRAAVEEILRRSVRGAVGADPLQTAVLFPAIGLDETADKGTFQRRSADVLDALEDAL